ncbi:MAG: hypothetical protein K8U57_21480 [Planctomycetes bacterium]|nr:hypothetical protein [Planctomycetota bacterium]
MDEHVWTILVQAGNYYHDLAAFFCGDDVSLCHEDDDRGQYTYAYSAHIDNLTDTEDVSKRLFSLQLLLNGSLRLDWLSVDRSPINFTDFAADKGLRHAVSPVDFEPYPFRAVIAPSFRPIPKAPATADRQFPSLLLHLASRSEELRTILFLVGLIRTHTVENRIAAWGTLYKIHDCVRTYSTQIGRKWESFVADAEMDKFTASVNSMAILGVFARHGAEKKTPPKRVITSLEEACNLILTYARNFCVAYVNAKFPEYLLSTSLPTPYRNPNINAEDLF